MKLVRYPLLLAAAVAFAPAAFTAGSSISLTPAPDGAAPAVLRWDGGTFELSGGGFRIHDATGKAEVALPRGTIASADGITTFETVTPDRNVRLRARFEPRGDHLVVRGEIENLRGDERGFIVDYRIPRLAPDAVFSYHLNHRVAMDQDAETENNAIPLAAMCTPGAGIALAIPPDEPRDFGLVGSSAGLTIRFYLGTSPKPQRFPNRASFVFLVYGAEPAWGFRSALGRYHGFYPDYYKQRLKKEGLMMFQMTDRMPANIEQYGFHLSETQWDRNVLLAALDRDEQHQITTFPYMIVGQREVKRLPVLPKTYAEAMAAFEGWTLASHAAFNHTKENTCARGDIHLKEEITSSAVQVSDGRFCIQLRNTPWGDNSVTFKINPNPDLFADKGGTNVGRLALELADEWLAKHPRYDGIFVDSLGVNWPAVLNYRPDHFVYARYPLTFDRQGRVALQNAISHYEYMDTLRTKMYATGRLTLGNGVYAYNSRKGPTGQRGTPDVGTQTVDKESNEFIDRPDSEPEHYRPGTKLGRFFNGALLDAASSEVGVRATIERCEDVRVIMGPKPYAFLNYHWENGTEVTEWINRCLGFGIYASSNTNWNTGVQYEIAANGYLRDKPLLDWYVPLVRRLTAAGWQPATYATVTGKGVYSERFGRGDTVYLTLFNDNKEPVTSEVQVDLAALGLAGRSVSITEIARQTEIYRTPEGRLRLTLAPRHAYVLQVKAAP